MHGHPAISRLQLLARLAAGDGTSLDAVLGDVVRTLGLSEAGLRWPIPGSLQINLATNKPPAEEGPRFGADVTARVAGSATVEEAFIDPNDPGRLFVPIVMPGRRTGMLWAVRTEPLNDEEVHTLIVIVHNLIRHPAFVDRIGPGTDTARINQRLQDASLVAGKIAHDFDNIFTGVVGFAEMVTSMLEPGSLPQQYVGEIASAGNRGIAFTQQLHQMSRSGVARPMPTALAGVLTREEIRLKKAAAGNVRLQFASPSDLPPVGIDATALQQLLSIVLDNAVEASPAGGAVRVSAALNELSPEEAAEYFGGATAGTYIVVRIADEGAGVKDEHRRKLFVEPFFTTKVRHRGLGLSVAYRILSAHRGGIRYEAGPGRGSTFHLVLPLASARAPEAGSTTENSRTPGGKAS